MVNASPADAAWLTALAGTKVQLTVPRYRMWEGRGYRVGINPVTAGLSQCDLYFKNYGGAEADTDQAELPGFVTEQFQDYSVNVAPPPSAVSGIKELVYPGGWSRSPSARASC